MTVRTASTGENTGFRLRRLHGSSRIETQSRTRIASSNGEQRWHTVGLAASIAVLLVVHTSEEKHGEEEIRIISARKASPRERALYHSPH